MADNNNDESVAIHSLWMPVFDGTHATFQVWWMQFTAFAIIHRFKAAINPEGVEGDLPVMEATEIVAGADGAPARAAVRRNSVAYANLSLALNSEQLVCILVAGQTTAWCGFLRVAVVSAAMLRKPRSKRNELFLLLFDKIMTIRNELLRYIRCQSQWQLIVIICRDTGWTLGPRTTLEPVSLGQPEVYI